jgi:8-oxo-dGTP pyrophosphatase MutT (NUDIX family)
MQQEISLPTVGILIIKKRKLLLAFSNNKRCFYLPGGKIDEGESAKAALSREVREELNISVTEDQLKYYTHISAPAFGEKEGIVMEQECFLLQDEIEAQASAEIGELKYFSLAEYLQQPHTAPGAVMVLEKLKAEGLID